MLFKRKYVNCSLRSKNIHLHNNTDRVKIHTQHTYLDCVKILKPKSRFPILNYTVVLRFWTVLCSRWTSTFTNKSFRKEVKVSHEQVAKSFWLPTATWRSHIGISSIVALIRARCPRSRHYVSSWGLLVRIWSVKDKRGSAIRISSTFSLH